MGLISSRDRLHGSRHFIMEVIKKEYSISKERLDNIIQTFPEAMLTRNIIDKMFPDYNTDPIYRTGSRFRHVISSLCCILAQIGPNLLTLIDLEEGNRYADNKVECKYARIPISWYVPDDHPLWGEDGRSRWTLVKA